MNDWNLMFVLDDGYVQQLLTTLNSIFANNESAHFTVHLFTDGFSESNSKTIESFFEKYDALLEQHLVPADLIDTDIMLGSKWSVVVYYKLFGFFELNVDRALYLDCDIIVDGKIDYLFEVDISKYLVMGVEDSGLDQVMWNEKIHLHKLGLSDDNHYINAGVMLLNIKKIKEEDSLSHLMNEYEKNSNRLVFNEQDLINMVWKDYIGLLDPKYNRLATDFRYRKKIMFDSDGVIYHYTVNKPWVEEYKKNKSCYLWCHDMYSKYSNIEECKELHQSVKKGSGSLLLKVKTIVKSLFGINYGMPIKGSSCLKYFIFKL